MSDSQETLKFQFELDFSDAEKKLQDFLNKASKSGSSSGGSKKAADDFAKDWDKAFAKVVQNQRAQEKAWGTLQAKIKQAQKVVSEFSDANGNATKGMEQGYATATNQLAALVKQQTKFAQNEQEIAQILQKTINLRNQANQALGGDKQYTPHSERQLQQLQKMQADMEKAAQSNRPGARFGTGFSQGAAFGGGLPGQGLAGAFDGASGLSGAMGVAGGILLSEVANKAGQALQQMSERVKATSQIISDGGGKYDRLFKSTQEAENAMARLADALPIAELETFKNNLVSAAAGLLKGIADAGKSQADKDKDKAQQDQRNLKLKGDAAIEEQRLMHDQASMEKEIQQNRLQFEHDIATKRRDYVLEVQETEMQLARKKEQLAIDAQRKEKDYQIQKAKFEEDAEGQVAQKKYELSQQQAERDHALKMQYAQQDFALQQSYKAQDFATNQSRNAEDYNDDLADMGASGASGLSYLQKARNYRKQQRRAAEDFAKQQGRDTTQFGMEQGRSQTEFANQRKDAADARAIEVAEHLNERKWEEIQMTEQHTRNLQDAAIAARNFAQDAELARKKLANKGSDLNFDEQMGRQKLGFDESEKRYQYGQQVMDFGKSMAGQLPPDMLQQLAKTDPFIAKALGAYTKASGVKLPSGQPNAAEQSGFDVGKAIGTGIDALGSIPFFNMFSPITGAKAAKGLLNGKMPWETVWDMLSHEGMPGHAAGGLMRDNHVAMVHSGEWIVNPSAPDKQKQMQYALNALSEMGFGFAGGFADGGKILGGIPIVGKTLEAAMNQGAPVGQYAAPDAAGPNAVDSMIAAQQAAMAKAKAAADDYAGQGSSGSGGGMSTLMPVDGPRGMAGSGLVPVSALSGQPDYQQVSGLSAALSAIGGGNSGVNLGDINVQAGLPADIQPLLQKLMQQYSNQVSSTVQGAIMKNLGSMLTRQTYTDESNRRSV